MATLFGKYLLQRKLAEGGMAEVFLARQSGEGGFEKPVVIKRILPHLSGEQHFLDMFLNEAKVAARLSHPAIVQIFDFGKADGQYFIAMEFIHGEDLRNLAKAAERHARRPSMALVCRIIADMLGGLHYAHTRSGPDGKRLGLVHRDVSPQNVLVTYEGGVKLVDFGIAKATESGDQQTQAGLLKGKYAYMSPEQCRGKGLDARSDVFAVGILLWELLTWKRLFRRETDFATLVAVAEDAIPRAASLRADLPPELDRICSRALARGVDDRYPSAQAMQADLEALIRKYGWEADSIRLQQYMREIFADKLAAQDEAIRAAGLGTIEDLLVQADEGTSMAWMDSASASGAGGTMPGGLELSEGSSLPPSPSDANLARPARAARPDPSGIFHHSTQQSVAIQPVPNWPPIQQPLGIGGDTGSTLSASVGEAVPVPDTTGSREVPLPATSGWKRVAVIVATGSLVAAAGLAAVFWPGSDGGPATPAAPLLASEAKIRVTVDEQCTVSVDGVAQPPGREVEVAVPAQVGHELEVKGQGAGHVRNIHVKPLEPGAVFPVTIRFAE